MFVIYLYLYNVYFDLKGMRWTNQIKSFALGMYFRSPANYRAMAKSFALPSVETLMKPLRNIMRNVSLYEILNLFMKILFRLKIIKHIN